MKRAVKITLILFLLAFGASAQSVGNGGWGNLTCSTTVFTDDTRAMIVDIDDSNGGYDLVELDATQSHSPGGWAVNHSSSGQVNRVLIMNMAQSQTPAPNRNYQITQIQAVFFNTPSTGFVTLRVNKFTKTNWCLSGSSTCQLQAILVPQYDDLTLNSGAELTCNAWDGYTGGVSCFLVKCTFEINTGAWVNVAQKGFINPNNAGFGGGPGNGRGGSGGYASLGGNGNLGAIPQSRLNHQGIAPPDRVFLGKAGAQGAGGKGGEGGGSGGNGGNGGNSMFTGLNGTSGNPGSPGGDGGYGGRGGGAIIVLATNIVVNASGQWVDLSAEDGTNAIAIIPTSSYGECGSGGDGGDAMCITGGLIGYGAGGVRGQRGNGAWGGQGGSGGSIGSSSIRASGTNQFSKTSHVKKNNGVKGSGGLGESIPPLTGTMGADGYPVDPTSCSTTINICEKNKYTVYDCACNEAYRVLGEMDEATEHTDYIEFQNTGIYSLPYYDKKNNNMVSMSPGSHNIQYCYYYKNSHLLIAFERVSNTPSTIFRNPRGSGTPVPVYNEYSYNVFWCKLNSADYINCNAIHSDVGTNINAYTAAAFIAPSSSILSTLSKATLYHTLNYDYGWVEFNGTSTAPANKYKYEDYTPYVNEQGELYEIGNSGNNCRKGCLPFEMEWVYPNDYYDGNSGYGGYGSGGSPPELPNLPFMEEIWDVPVEGGDGEDGEDGEGGDDNSDDGSFPPGGDDDEGNLMFVRKINAENNNFALYPNPGGKLVYISSKKILSTKVSISLTDINGKIIHKQDEVELNANTYQLNLENLQTGIYLVKISDNQGVHVLRLVKE